MFDILQIQFDYLTKLFKGTQQPLYLFADKNFEGPTDLAYTTILYDGAAAYMQRLATCIEQVPASYFILSHENDVLLKYDASAMNALATSMKGHHIDSIDLKHNQHNKDARIKITETLYIVKVGKDDMLAFCVQPRLWRKSAAKEFFTVNRAKGYRNSENANVQKYSKEHQLTYELYSEKSIQSWYFGVDMAAPEYLFIHITNGAKFSPKPQTKGVTVDPIVQKELDTIQRNYIDVPHATREQADANFDPNKEVY